MANSEPVVKTCKLDSDNGSIFETFLNTRKCDVEKLRVGIQALKYGLSNCQVRAVKVTQANASLPADFTSAYLEFGETDSIRAIGNIYKDACIILDDYISSDLEAGNIKIPDESERRQALAVLLIYLQNLEKESRAVSQYAFTFLPEEGTWTLKVAQHLFSKLSLNPHYVYDIYDNGRKGGCPCFQKDEMVGDSGDTSFGLETGWHGKTDILMGDVPVFTKGTGTDIEKCDSSVSSHSSDSDSSTSNEVDFSVKDYHQIFAKIITYSFLKNKTRSQLSLNPLIAINKDSIQVHFYDSENDVLLQSGLFPLFPRSMNLNNIAVLVIWIVLNHSLFYTGPTEGMPKSGFHELINVDAYKQGVKSPCHLKENNTDQQWICNKFWASEAVPLTTY